MKKTFISFIVIGFTLFGCSQESKNEISEPIAENGLEVQIEPETNSKAKMHDLELKGAEEIDIFTRAVSNSNKEPGIVNMADKPQYQLSIGEETYFLWITEGSGTIMNTKDTHTIYALSGSSNKEVYEVINKVERTVEEKNPELEVNSTFSIPVTFGDGKDGDYILVGEKEKLAFQIGSKSENETIELQPIEANKPDKYMWYLWGENLSGKPFKVIGTNTDTQEDLVVVEDRVLGAELNGADAHTPSLMEFPTDGLWKLDAYIDEKLFGSIMVKIE